MLGGKALNTRKQLNVELRLVDLGGFARSLILDKSFRLERSSRPSFNFGKKKRPGVRSLRAVSDSAFPMGSHEVGRG